MSYRDRAALAASIGSLLWSFVAGAANGPDLLMAQAAQPARAGTAAKAASAAAAARLVTRSATLPARGLFTGDQLSTAAQQHLSELVIDALELDVQVALVVPTGPWQIDGRGEPEHRLTPARLQAVRKFLVQRGVDAKHVYVESRIDARLKEPQLVIELVGPPSSH